MKPAKIFTTLIFLLAFAFQIPAQRFYPNELKDHRFFGRGRLKSLTLGVSTKTQVKSVFENDCNSIEGCRLNAGWKVRIIYFSEITEIHKDLPNGETIKFVPNRQFIGTIQEIWIFPIKKILLSDGSFAEKFKPDAMEITAQFFSEDKRGFVSSKIYKDTFGLKYFISDKDANIGFQKNELLYISYELPERDLKRILVQKK